MARIAAAPLTLDALHVHPDGWFGVRIKLGLEPETPLLPVERACDELDDASKMREGDPTVDLEPLELMKHRQVCSVDGFVAIHSACRRDFDW